MAILTSKSTNLQFKEKECLDELYAKGVRFVMMDEDETILLYDERSFKMRNMVIDQNTVKKIIYNCGLGIGEPLSLQHILQLLC